jgi:hypothetical protein
MRQYEIFADYHQFYLWDHGTSPEPPVDYTDEDIDHRIKATPFVVVIQPERNMDVPVQLELRDTPPDEPLEGWDHVAEASLDLPSGQLEIHQCTGGSVDIVPLRPGPYRVRAYYGGLGTLSEDGLEGQDHYHLVLWPAPLAPLAVLKQYAGGQGG